MRLKAPVVLAMAMLIAKAQVALAQRGTSPRVDSIVLERTPCFGACSAYRLSIAASGAIAFQSRNLEDLTRLERATKSKESWGKLIRLVDQVGFDRYPDDISSDKTLCATVATDHPTAIVTVFRRSSQKRVTDYLGCFTSVDHAVAKQLLGLRNLERAIDDMSESSRWVRPARSRS